MAFLNFSIQRLFSCVIARKKIQFLREYVIFILLSLLKLFAAYAEESATEDALYFLGEALRR